MTAPGAAPLRVFVVGCSRGGTTLMQRLVAERLGLCTLPETRFFANMIGNVEPHMFPTTQRPIPLYRHASSRLREALGRSTGMRLLDIPGIPPIEGRRWAPFAEMTAQFVTRMDALAQAQGAAGWLEKTPFHVFYARTILRLVPGAWIIHILRDAEETIGSIRDAARRYNDPWAIIYDRVERDVDNWNASTAASAAMIGRPRQIFIPYAALTRAPESVMDRVAHLVGDPAAARPVAQPAEMTSVRDQTWKRAAISGPVAPVESKWSTALTAGEQARARALIRPVPADLMREMAPFMALAGLTDSVAA